MRQLPVDSVRSLKFRETAPEPENQIRLLLRDESTLRPSGVSSDGSMLEVELPGVVPALKIPSTLVASVQFRELTEAQRESWQALAGSRISADMLIVVRSEQALDKIEGLVIGLSDEAATFEFDGQTIPAPISKLAGLRFYAANQPELAKPFATVTDIGGNRWLAASLEMATDGEAIELKLQGGFELKLPAKSIAEVDFSAGSALNLAELVWIDSSVASRMQLVVDSPGAFELFGPRIVSANRKDSPQASPAIEFFGGGSATYQVPEGFSKLVGEVELSPSGHLATACRVAILLEKKVVWEAELNEVRAPVAFDIAVGEGQRAELLVRPSSEIPVGDIVVWRNVFFIR